MAFGKVTLSGAVDNIKEGWTKFNSLIDDLLSTSNGKGASQIGIEDTAGNMSSANVEAALAEIYSDHSSTRTLAEILDENSATTTGLTWGYKAGSIVVDNVVTSISAGTIALTDNATNYVEVQANGTVSRNTTAFTTGRIPIRQVVTLAGAQTTSTDKRAWFSREPAATVTQIGVAELSTDAEAVTGTDTGRTVTPANLTARLAAPGAIGGTTPAAITCTDLTVNGDSTIGNESGDTLTFHPAAWTLSNAVTITGTVVEATFANTGLHLLDTNASHDLIIKPGSDLTADRTLTLTTGDSARTVTINGDPTLNDWFDQGVKTTSSPTFTAVSTDTISEETGGNGVAIDSLTIKDAGFALGSDADGDVYYRASGALARLAKGSAGQVLTMNSGATAPEWQTGGALIQSVHTQTGAVATGTTAIPFDDTIPQITEGDEYMTLAITPKNTANILIIDAIVQMSSTAIEDHIVALFQDSGADALASVLTREDATRTVNISLRHKMTAGTTSSTTFRIRAGGQSGTITFNGTAGSRKLGGVQASSITITEIKP